MENLRFLMAEYLHQDWQDLYTDWRDAVAAFTVKHPEAAAAVPHEIDALLAQNLDPDSLSRVVTDLGTAHDPSAFGQTDAEWLADVKQQVRDTLADHCG